MKIDKQKAKKIISVICFLLLIWTIFLRCTYLFRNTTGVLRRNVVGFYAEEEDSLDVVFVGGSNVYRYWDCMQAWNDYGFTSYNYGASAMAAGTTLAAIKEVEKTQNPQLIVVDVRKFLSQYLDTEFNEGVKNVFDAQDYNLNRLTQVDYFRRLNGISVKDAIPEYVDLVGYHSNYEALTKKTNWQFSDNRTDKNLDADGYYKGFAVVDWHTFLEQPTAEYVDDFAKMEPVAEKLFVDVMKYCQKKELELLWVCAPFSLNETDMKEMNEMKRLAEEYNYEFIDFNMYYEEMGVDFSTDFYNEKHMNLLGAEKYTDFLAQYIVDNYNVPDHREDSEYARWNQVYQDYIIVKEEKRNGTIERINKGYSLLAMEDRMRQTDSILDWVSMAKNDDLVVFTIIQKPIKNTMSYTEATVMSEFGVNNSVIKRNSFVASYNEELLKASSDIMELTGKVSYTPNSKSYRVSLEENIIEVDDKQFPISSANGIQMYVYDKNFNTIVDSVTISIMEDGSMELTHME